MHNFLEIIEKIKLEDNEFKNAVSKTLKNVGNSENLSLNSLKVSLDLTLNFLKILNSSSYSTEINKDIYFDENFIKIFSGTCTDQDLNESYNLLNAILTSVKHEDQKTALIFTFLELIFNYKSKKDNIQLEKLREQIEAMLRYKNHMYGDAALNPISFFTSVEPLDLISIQLNNKIMRILSSNNKKDELEDAVLDIIGYLVLYCIHYEKTL